MFNVIVDAHGGDHAPYEIVKGAVEAVKVNDKLVVTLVGKEKEINEILNGFSYNKTQIKLINANTVITNDDSPTFAIRKMQDSSLVVALNELKDNENYSGLVSAGSTGAVLTGAVLKLGRIKGVSRPALCPILPTVNGGIVGIVDVGANMDAKPENLVQFALMGKAYLENVLGIKNPRIALLNVGVEKGKGNELTKEVFEKLSEIKDINFVGNMESRTLLSGEVDLVVTDGFAGNVLLKSTEGAILSVLKLLKTEIKSSFLSKVGYLFMKKSFKNLKTNLDYSDKGGAVFLGCKHIVIKSHGTSKASSIKSSIEQVVHMSEVKLVQKIEEGVESLLTQTEIEK